MHWISQILLFVTTAVTVSVGSNRDSYSEERPLHDLELDILRHQLAKEAKERLATDIRQPSQKNGGQNTLLRYMYRTQPPVNQMLRKYQRPSLTEQIGHPELAVTLDQDEYSSQFKINQYQGKLDQATQLQPTEIHAESSNLDQIGYSEGSDQPHKSEGLLEKLLSRYLGKFGNNEQEKNVRRELPVSSGYLQEKHEYQQPRSSTNKKTLYTKQPFIIGKSEEIEPLEYQRLPRRLEGTRYPGQIIQQVQYGKPEYGSYTGQTVRQHSLDYSREPEYSLGYAGGRRQQEYQEGLKRERSQLGYPGEQTGPGYYDVRGNFGNTEQPKERRYSGQSSYQIPIEYSKEKPSEQIGVSGQNKAVNLEDLLQEEIRQGQLSILKKRQDSAVSGGSQTHTSSKNSGTLKASGSVENSG